MMFDSSFPARRDLLDVRWRRVQLPLKQIFTWNRTVSFTSGYTRSHQDEAQNPRQDVTAMKPAEEREALGLALTLPAGTQACSSRSWLPQTGLSLLTGRKLAQAQARVGQVFITVRINL